MKCSSFPFPVVRPPPPPLDPKPHITKTFPGNFFVLAWSIFKWFLWLYYSVILLLLHNNNIILFCILCFFFCIFLRFSTLFFQKFTLSSMKSGHALQLYNLFSFVADIIQDFHLSSVVSITVSLFFSLLSLISCWITFWVFFDLVSALLVPSGIGERYCQAISKTWLVAPRRQCNPFNKRNGGLTQSFLYIALSVMFHPIYVHLQYKPQVNWNLKV